MPRYADKRDENERPIIDAMRAAGATVVQLQAIRAPGLPDLLVGFRGRTFLIEVKPDGERLRDDQDRWHRTWAGSAVVTVRTPEQGLEAIGAI